MNKTDMLEQIATLPRRFHSQGDVSMFSLVKATGYFEFHDQISELDIRAALAQCPECVGEWIHYSEDQRTSGWYITQDDEGRYEVGYVGESGDRTKRVYYNNRIDACASFIKHAIEGIRLA